jgi:hypothetical protein
MIKATSKGSMTRFERKNRTDIIYKGCGGITDAFDDMYKQLWRINDDEYDYLCETLTDEELKTITPEFKTISEIKKAINIVNTVLSKK